MFNAIEEASITDAERIVSLVNQAYRPDASLTGWTHEAELVSGKRTSTQQVRALFKDNSTILVMRDKDCVVACVHIERFGYISHIGMLATSPSVQGMGIGKHMLAAAESLATNKYAATRLKMSILSSRPELLAYYNRRGYVLTGNIAPYPIEAAVGVPTRKDLHVLELHKQSIITSNC